MIMLCLNQHTLVIWFETTTSTKHVEQLACKAIFVALSRCL